MSDKFRPKKINKYDLNAIVHLLLEKKFLVPFWKNKELRVTYSFPQSVQDIEHMFPKGVFRNFRAFSKSQKKALKLAFKSFNEVTNFKFEEVDNKPRGHKSGNIQLFNIEFYHPGINTNNSNTAGANLMDRVKENHVEGYIYINTSTYDNKLKKNRYNQGSHFTHTLRHELLHGLGFGHCNNQVIDKETYSEMSYKIYNSVSPSSLSLYDVLTLHAAYGANMLTRTENNTYDLTLVGQNGSKNLCIWDAGGTDTLIIENNGVNDIREGEFSCDECVSIAYGCHIENVICSHYGDVKVFLNGLDNNVKLKGGGNTLYFSDININTQVNFGNIDKPVVQKIQNYKIVNGKKYSGWGNDIVASTRGTEESICHTNNNPSLSDLVDIVSNQEIEKMIKEEEENHFKPNQIIFDVSNPLALQFKIDGKDLIVSHKTKRILSQEECASSLRVKNFVSYPNDYLFFVRSRSADQSEKIKKKYSDLYALANKKIAHNSELQYQVDHNSAFEKRILDYDQKVAFINKKQRISKTHSYIPLAVER